VGLKPTYGRISRLGIFPLAPSLDHVGPITRSVEDAARMLQVLAGPDPGDPTTLPDSVPAYASALADGQVDGLTGTTIGVDWAYVTRGVEAAVVDTLREALARFRELGAVVREVAMPSCTATLIAGWSITCGVECARAHEPFYPARRTEYGAGLAGLIEIGRAASLADYRALEAVRGEFRAGFDRLLETVDLMIAPCMPVLPPALEALESPSPADRRIASFLSFTAPFNYSGHPALVLPAGFAAGGLPQAFQLVGRRLGEPALLRAAFAYEQSQGGASHPDL
jgi:amidase